MNELPLIYPAEPGYIEGVVSFDPPVLQCQECGVTADRESLGVAARVTGRRAVCFEVRESQCEAAAARLDQGVLDFTGESA